MKNKFIFFINSRDFKIFTIARKEKKVVNID